MSQKRDPNMNSGVKSAGIDSPKTPGGISKSLLTPCRRVGLSRKWGKRGPSPFISPLSNGKSSSADVKVEKDNKKRKRCNSEDTDSIHEIETEINSTPKSTISTSNNTKYDTPVRNVSLSKKKSKTLLMKEIKEAENIDIIKDVDPILKETKSENSETISNNSTINKSSPLSKLSRTNSKSKLVSKKIAENNVEEESLITDNESKENGDTKCEKTVKKRSPNNLTKECVVLIQKKMIKRLKLDKVEQENSNANNSISQTLFDSDSDDTPLCALSKKENVKTNTDLDNDFIDTKVVKLQDKKTSTTGLKTKIKNIVIPKLKPKIIEINTSQNSFEDDDDFECFNKRTILVKKSYDKVIKPVKAKSTGSITQRDIDELKARIEMKKNLLVAKTMSEDTEELRNLIKKWQRGCQEALFELFDLMRNKFPDKKNMDYSEILQTLKIPPDLVGYDVENDCFVTPDDRSLILSSINT
ncbi:uncharacterized protein LOC123702853 [Colias croceus]|uniref:uncharacterized protein LOC123702853 n=1 Tax=Colias crocea TaxID=72248 RepID=UPI001E27E115|nr:uncharacterized protein LOC123702853 [Colias croceus]